MSDKLCFHCDQTGRWLIAGYDTVIADCGRRDRHVVEQSHAEGRILRTRTRRLVRIPPGE